MMERPVAIRIVVADDHVLFAEGLARLLSSEPGFEVVATCRDGEDAVRQVLALQPDVLLIDLAMPHIDGLEALQQLSDGGCRVRSIIVTADIDSDETLRAIQLGSRGVLLKDAAGASLFKCIRAVMRDEYWLGRDQFSSLARRLHDRTQHEGRPPASTLSARELDIVEAVLGGATNKEIATQFAISPQTVKNHLSSIFDKLGVSTRLELALYARHHHLLDKRFQPPKQR